MEVVHSNSGLTGAHGGVFVPTMGALHRGHAALVRRAVEVRAERGIAGPVVVSVFVNRTQFNEPADFERYPRTLQADVELCHQAGADVVYAPPHEEVYPIGVAVGVPSLPEQATGPGLEDSCRPGHFAGVCQVVLRLLSLVRPHSAVFGEKDWQQLQVVRAMVSHEGVPVNIVGAPTVREADGLAMSSRNRFLTASERGVAPTIYRALQEAGRNKTVEHAEGAMRRMLESAGFGVEYAVIRHAATLKPIGAGASGPARSLIAARLGSVRLIDNAEWPVEQSVESRHA